MDEGFVGREDNMKKRYGGTKKPTYICIFREGLVILWLNHCMCGRVKLGELWGTVAQLLILCVTLTVSH